jgi:uncharacterized repeat protein (TIGR03803 family)
MSRVPSASNILAGLALACGLAATASAGPSAAAATPSFHYEVIHRFTGGDTDGVDPVGGLTVASDGNLYGTTSRGGTPDVRCTHGCGTIFRLTPDGVVTIVYAFLAAAGSFPATTLVQASDGNLYGILSFGPRSGVGGGVAFRFDPRTGIYTTIHDFQQDGVGGNMSGLIAASDGNLYGVVEDAGGYVYRMTLDGAVTTIHSFTQASGLQPVGPLLQARNGNLFGATSTGGDGRCRDHETGCGTIFEMTLDGALIQSASVSARAGQMPNGALVQAADGTIWGTSVEGGRDVYVCATFGCGTVFKFDASPGGRQAVHYFDYRHGATPEFGMMQAPDGSMIGTTPFGGISHAYPKASGVIFRIAPDGTYQTLHVFTDSPDGLAPSSEGAPVVGPDGAIYGTTSGGGTPQGLGTIYRIVMH